MKLPTNRAEIFKGMPRGSVGAEIGVLKGRFSSAIIKFAEPSVLYLVDCWECRADGDAWDARNPESLQVQYMYTAASRLAKESCKGVVRILCGLSVEVAKLFEDASLDWVYIDADHTKKGCLDDLRAWYPKVRSGGIMSGHDYLAGFEGQAAWCGGKNCPPDRRLGVIGAVTKFVGELTGIRLHITEEVMPSFWWTKP